MKIVREVTPIEIGEPFVILEHENAQFDYPLHFHPEYEINFVEGFKGHRTVGDLTEYCEGKDLVLLGPFLNHIWKMDIQSSKARVVTIQFREDFLGEKMLKYSAFKEIKKLLIDSRKGIYFSQEKTLKVREKVNNLCKMDGFTSFHTFIDLLHDLALDKGRRILSNITGDEQAEENKSRRIHLIMKFIEENFADNIKAYHLAEMVNMSESAFSHFFKKRTGKSLTTFILEIRLNKISKMLVETEISISEICYRSGFKTLSNFNKMFKRRYDCTPKEYRIKFRKLSLDLKFSPLHPSLKVTLILFFLQVL